MQRPSVAARPSSNGPERLGPRHALCSRRTVVESSSTAKLTSTVGRDVVSYKCVSSPQLRAGHSLRPFGGRECMADLAYVIATFAFFAIAWLYARAFEQHL